MSRHYRDRHYLNPIIENILRERPIIQETEGSFMIRTVDNERRHVE